METASIPFEPFDAAGIHLAWQDGFEVTVAQTAGETVVRGNSAGLLSLASHLVALAQEQVPSGTHLHLDEANSLEPGSIGIVFERTS